MRILPSLLPLLLLAGCGLLGEKRPAGQPMAGLLAAGVPPVEVRSLGRSIGPVPAFQAELKNLSDKQVQAVKWTAVFRTAEGVPLKEGPIPGGFGEFGGLKPGEVMQGSFHAPEEAATVTLVLKDLIYEDTVQGLKINKSWRNPRHDPEVKAALGADAKRPAAKG